MRGFNLVHRNRWKALLLPLLTLVAWGCMAAPCYGVSGNGPKLAATPPMGWAPFPHHQDDFNAQMLLANARALVSTGLAERGYKLVEITGPWTTKKRNFHGDLVPDPAKFPNGMKPFTRAIHAMGLKVDIYEDAGYETCSGWPGSGQPKGGGKDYFLQDAKLFASWGVDYLKLDGCYIYVPAGETREEANRKAYAAEAAALKAAGRAVVFNESAPAYFMGTPEWYDVLTWVRQYGQSWRTGSDIQNFDSNYPNRSRFKSVLWNYAYNLQLGRFQKPGNWDDPDYVIAGDKGLTLAESRSQFALWSMMSAPLFISVDITTISPQVFAILGDKRVIAIDQDPLGQMASLVRRTPTMDVLFKHLANGDDAVAVFNRGSKPIQVGLNPADLGFRASPDCRLDAQNLWSGKRQSGVSALKAEVASHDTAIWRIHASAACGQPTRTGAITLSLNVTRHHWDPDTYTRCLIAPGSAESRCTGVPAERWTVTRKGALRSYDGRCLSVVEGQPKLTTCHDVKAQHWRYTLRGNLIAGPKRQCLTATWLGGAPDGLEMLPCGHNQINQVWSLPN